MTKLQRQTKETNIVLELEVNGSGKSNIKTGIGFFDHMLEAFAKHSLIDLKIECEGDLHVDFHHSVEDVGIVLGEALYKEIFPVGKIERFSNVVAVLDEAAIECDLDISGRAFLHYDVDISSKVGEFDTELAEEFFRAVVINAKITAHIIKKRGKNRHHILEAAFKAFGVALRRALIINPKITDTPSTKGILW